MADIRLTAAEMELGLGHRGDVEDPYAEIPRSDRPDADLRPSRSRDELEEDLGLPPMDLDDPYLDDERGAPDDEP